MGFVTYLYTKLHSSEHFPQNINVQWVKILYRSHHHTINLANLSIAMTP